ncbi:MAG: histidinol dehydrogenase [Pseudomonadota bacterium]
MAERLDARASGFAAAFARLLAAKRETAADVDAAVAAIVAEVRCKGDAALIAYTRRFDGFELAPATLRVPADEIASAHGACARETLDALGLAARRIEDFHRRQVPADFEVRDPAGLTLGIRWTAIGAVGLYVPGGTAAYPSSVLMNAIPAKVAGVPRVAMTVPAPQGEINPLVLAAAKIAGVDEIYRVGGAQAVAALAWGTATIAPVDKIVGPGNAYVAAAKRQVFGQVGIDMIAGPSEILVVADSANDPAWIAADLLAQAEHDVSAQAILMTDDADFADATMRALEGHLKILPRAATARASWEKFGAVIVLERLADAVPLIDRLAPEHLALAIENPEALARRVRNAGAIFMGRFTPEAIGDYIAGPNHVLPTARSARFSSGLGVWDFMKRTSLIACGADGLAQLGPAAIALARAEGLDAHALSLAVRLNRRPDP